MKQLIFDLTGKKIGSYEGELDESSNTRSHLLCPPLAIHKELPEGMDEDLVKLIFLDEVEVPEEIITPAYDVPEQIVTPEQIIEPIPAVPGTPAVGVEGEEGYIPAVEEIPEVPGYTIPAVIIPAHTVPAVVNPAYTMFNQTQVVIDEVLEAAKMAASKAIELQVLYDEMVADVYDKMEILFGTRNDVSAAATASTWEAMEKRPANYVNMTPQLTSEALVVAYATAQLNLADAYAKWRLGRLAQFNAAKAAL